MFTLPSLHSNKMIYSSPSIYRFYSEKNRSTRRPIYLHQVQILGKYPVLVYLFTVGWTITESFGTSWGQASVAVCIVV